MHRCCAQACGVSPVCDVASCNALGGRGTCTYPNPASTTAATPAPTALDSCAADSDTCLQQSPAWGSSYKCSSSTGWCSSWSKDMHRCCAQACGVSPVCDVASCNALGGRGTCTYPNPASTVAATTAPTPTPTPPPTPAPTFSSCAIDSDTCLQQSPAWGSSYKCSSSTGWCSSWSK